MLNMLLTTKASIPIVKVLFQKDWVDLHQLMDISTDSPAPKFSSSESLLKYLSTQSCGLVFASVASKEDLVEVARLIHGLQKANQKELIKVVIVDFSAHRFDRILAKLEIQEVIDPKIHLKGLKFKVDFWLQGIESISRKRKNQNEKIKGNRVQPVSIKLVKNGEDNSSSLNIGMMTENTSFASIICRGDRIFPCVLDDLFENNFIFKLTENEFRDGELLDFYIKGKYQEKKFFLKAQGKVTLIHRIHDNEFFVTLEMVDSQEDLFEELMALYQERQKNVTTFMNASRGLC